MGGGTLKILIVVYILISCDTIPSPSERRGQRIFRHRGASRTGEAGRSIRKRSGGNGYVRVALVCTRHFHGPRGHLIRSHGTCHTHHPPLRPGTSPRDPGDARTGEPPPPQVPLPSPRDGEDAWLPGPRARHVPGV